MEEDFTSTLLLPIIMKDHILTPYRFCDKYEFTKPNDRAAIDLMNEAAKSVMRELPDITIAYGISDEFR